MSQGNGGQQVDKKTDSQGMISIALFVMMVFSFLGVLYYIFVVFRDEMTSDCVDTMFWTQMMVDYGRIFTPGFEYAALIPFGGQLFMYPFVKMLGVTMKAQMLSMALFAAVFGAAVYFCAKEIFDSGKWGVLAVSMMFSTLLVSEKLREIFWGHIIYYSLGVLFFSVALYLVCRMLKMERGRSLAIYGVVLFVWMFLTATDGLLSLVQCMVPVFGALVLQWCLNGKQGRGMEWKLYVIGTIICVAGLLGYVAGSALQGDLVAGYANAYSSFDAPSDWMDNLLKLLPQWYQLLGVDVKSGDLFLSAKGMINLLRIVFATVLAVIPVVMLFLLPRIEKVSVRLLVFAHWIMTGIIMLAYVFGKLSAGNWRLSPIVCSAVLLLVAFVRLCMEGLYLKRLGIVFSAACVAVCLAYTGNVMAKDSGAYKKNVYYGLSRVLQENDLTYGYATFWNAGVITLMSDSNVQVRNVQITSGLDKYAYQSDKAWYEDQPGQEDYFLLLTKREFSELASGGDGKIGDYYDFLEYENYYILIYDHNIF